jgi:hypothetical protein
LLVIFPPWRIADENSGSDVSLLVLLAVFPASGALANRDTTSI